MFYNVQTTYWTSISKTWTHEYDAITLHNFKLIDIVIVVKSGEVNYKVYHIDTCN